MQNPNIKVSVIVPCRNERQHIQPFLDSLRGQDLEGLDCEVLIADGMSTDGTREVVERMALEQRSRDAGQAHIRVIGNPGRFVSQGLNAAIRAAQGEIILRMDCHTAYAPDYIQGCVAALYQTGADNVGGAARTVAACPNQGEGPLAGALAAAYASRFSTGGAKFHDPAYEGWVDTVTYGCWRKSTLLRLGLFDEELVRNQDDELNLRLIRAGGRIWQSRRIVSWYRMRGSISSLFRQYFQYGFWKVKVIQKHRIPASWRHLAPGAFAASNILLAVCGAVLLLSGSPWAVWSAGIWAALLAAYVTACLFASLVIARKSGWKLFPWLPLIFATYHVSYGAGFLLGTLYWPLRRKGPARLWGFVADLTR